MEKSILDKVSLRGEIVITAECQETGMIRTHDDHNVLVEMLSEFGASSYDWSNMSMKLSAKRLAKNVTGMPFVDINERSQTTRLSKVVSPRVGRDLDDWYIEEIFRFDATGVAEEINSIFLTGYNNSVSVPVVASIGLNNTFNQGPTDLLSIKYRFILNTTSLTEMEAFQVTASFDWALNGAAGYNGKEFIPGYYTPNFRKASPYFNAEYSDRVDGGYNGSSAPGKTGITFNVDKPDHVGWHIAGVALMLSTDNDDLLTGTSGTRAINFNTICSPSKHAAFVNYPLGPLFNHGPTALHNFEDIDNLAAGIGYPVIGSIPEPTWAIGDLFKLEAQRFNITKSGNVGTARYEIALEPISPTGMSASTVAPRSCKFGQFAAVPHGGTVYRTDIVDSPVLMNPVTHPIGRAVSDYNSQYMIHSDMRNGDQAICLVNILNKEDVYGWDTLTTPALPSGSGVDLEHGMIKRNEQGDLFYLTTDGYAVIRNPLGTPTVEVKALASIGLPDPLVGIDVTGIFIQVVSEYGMAYSLDNGVTWTTHVTSLRLATTPTNLIGGDIDNPALVIPFYFNEPAVWLDAANDTVVPLTSNTSDVSFGDGWFDPVAKVFRVCWRSDYANNQISVILKPGEVKAAVTYRGAGMAASQSTSEYLGSFRMMRDRLGNWVMTTIMQLNSHEVLMHFDDGTYATAPIQDGAHIDYGTNWYKCNTSCRTHVYDEYDGIVDYHYGKFAINNGYSDHTDFWTPGDAGALDNIVENAAFGLLPYYSKLHRWDNSTNTWKNSWNAPTPATSDGTYVLTADRIGFNTDSNTFNGFSSVDISAALNAGTYTSGISLAMYVTSDDTGLGTFAGDWRSVVGSSVSPVSAVTELKDVATGKSVTLLHRGYDDTVMLLDNTDSGTTTIREVSLGVSPLATASRYVMTIDSTGTNVKVYRNGAQIGGTIVLDEALPLTGTLSGSIGTTLTGANGIASKASGFIGGITNSLIYGKTLTGAEVASDNAVPEGLNVTSSLVARFLLNADYGEGRITHVGVETNLHDLQIRFDDGDLSSDSYVVGDNYFTTKSAYGYVEDNATSRKLTLLSGLTYTFTNECTSPSTGANVIPAIDGMVTDHLMPFSNNGKSGFSIGQSATTLSTISKSPSYTGFGLRGSPIFEFEEGTPDSDGTVHFITSERANTVMSSSGLPEYSDLFTIDFSANGDVTVGGTTVTGTRQVNRRWRVELIESSNSYSVGYYDDSSTYISVLTLEPMTIDMTLNVDGYFMEVPTMSADMFTIMEVRGTGLVNNRLMILGDKTNESVAYSRAFRSGLTDAGSIGSIKIQIAGIDQLIDYEYQSTKVWYMSGISDSQAGSSEPPVGTVRYHASMGLLEVNSSEVGKIITLANVPVDVANVILD